MLDAHIHIEKGDYTLDWIEEFVDVAIQRGLNEIYLLEHCYRFSEFVPMYDSVCKYSEYINKWFSRKSGVLNLNDYLTLINKVRQKHFPIKIKMGLEICYFKEHEEFINNLTKDCGFDFLTGSVHFIDDFAFDHKAEHWQGVDVDKAYRRYFETSEDLIKSGLFTGIAHPDCIKLFGHKSTFKLTDTYKSLAKLLVKQDMYAEQSGGIFRRNTCGAELGMNKEMLEIFKKEGVKILTASDAHCPEDVGVNIKELETILNGV